MGYAKPIQDLIDAFSRLPSVGRRTAERYVFYLLKSGKKDVAELTLALKGLIENVKSCDICWDFADASPCHICQLPNRDKHTICVVAEPQDLQAIEHIGEYNGRYHVLRGTVNPGKENFAKFLKIKELVQRASSGHITEVILALNHDLPGEATMMLIEHQLKQSAPDVVITRLARGLPMGSDLQYADEITLGSALKHRTSSN